MKNMFMNIDQVPPGHRLFTIAVTNDPVDTPASDVCYDEIDVTCAAPASIAQIIEAADLEGQGYADCRVVGISNQSDGYIVAQAPNGDLR